MTGIRELAARTPAQRERYVDLLRAVAIVAVVLGHWLIMVVEYDSGELTGTSALGDLTWAHPVTWLFQVMPVFFLVGGFANAASRTAHRRRGGGSDTAWLLERSARLVRPTTALLVVLAAGALLARALGIDPDQVGTAVWLASLPLWFLVVYLGVVALTPPMHALHRRYGLAVPVLLLVPVAVGDLLRLWHGQEAWAYGSFACGWLAVHQLGFAWRDGTLPTGRRAATALLAGGLATLVALTWLGPYPVSMVTVPGETMQNASPPSVALLALAAAQLGLALLVRDRCERWLRRPGPWTAVVATNAAILTVFLWHMTAAVLVTVVLHALGRLPTPAAGSTGWLLWRVPWVAMLAVALAGLVAVFGRIESRGLGQTRAAAGRVPPRRPGWWRRPGWLTAAAAGGYAAVVLGLLWQAAAGRSGSDGPFGMPTGALLLFLAGAAVLRAARAFTRPGSPRGATASTPPAVPG